MINPQKLIVFCNLAPLIFHKIDMNFTALQIADFIGGTIEGDPNKEIDHLAKITESNVQSLVFLDNSKYEPYLYESIIGIAIVNNNFHITKRTTATIIRVSNSRKAFSKLLQQYENFKNHKEGIEQPCFISDGVSIPQDSYIGMFTYIGKDVTLEKGVKIYPQTYVGDETKIGKDTTIYAGVKIYPRTQIGKKCILHSGSVIGSDGFGYTTDSKGTYEKVPHIGNVILEDEVEIGANTTIDRATLGSTRIGKGVKLDNLVQVAHNVVIKKHTVMAAQAGVAGSTILGEHSVFGGQSAIVGHLNLGNHIKVQGQSGVTKNLKDNEIVQGTPAMNYNGYHRSYVHFKQFDKLVKRIHSLEKKINNLEK